jgi:hypothetical protein
MKKTKPTELDRIAAQLQTMLRHDTISVIEKGKLLLRSRELLADQHGDWLPWLEDNFDLSPRTANNYCNAAEYVMRKIEEAKSETVSDFANIAPTVLYRLANGGYMEREEAEILAQAKTGKRIDQTRADNICDSLAAEDEDAAKDDDAANEDENEGADAEDPDAAKILDEPPPEVPPPSPSNVKSPSKSSPGQIVVSAEQRKAEAERAEQIEQQQLENVSANADFSTGSEAPNIIPIEVIYSREEPKTEAMPVLNADVVIDELNKFTTELVRDLTDVPPRFSDAECEAVVQSLFQAANQLTQLAHDLKQHRFASK